MVPFAGYSMPVLYTSITEEHRAVRTRSGLFDVSHMGEARLVGRDALALAQRVFTNDVKGLSEGRVRYGLLCLESGGVVDDVTVFRTRADEVLFCLNASNTDADLGWIEEVRSGEGFECQVIDESERTGLVAIQGPESVNVIGPLLAAGASLPRPWRFERLSLAGIPVLLSRTGYTGEDGFEIFVDADRTAELWEALRAPGPGKVALAGLGARDTLRTEMAYPLYGHELDRTRTPIEAGLERFLSFGAGFIGEEALARLRDEGPATRRVGLVLDGRAMARPGYPILDGEPLGTVTSGTWGPTVERSIAIGYVPAGHAEPGTRLAVEIRSRPAPCEVVQTPFYRRKD
jgi:aminomethyltransferase